MTLPPTYPERAPAPLTGAQLTDLVTGLVGALTGIAPALVRPRWQATPPQQPPAGTAWCGAGIVARSDLDYTHQEIGNIPGTAIEALHLRRWGDIEVLLSFYGPDSDGMAERFRDGMYVTINLAHVAAAGIRLHRVGDVTQVPDLVNMQYIDHCDVRVWFARQIDRWYPLKSLIEASGTLTPDLGVNVLLDSAEAAPV